MKNGTGIYLGDGWVLTPYHVYQSEAEHSRITLDQQRFDEIPQSSKRIKFNANTDADLVMFRINGNPSTDYINIRQSGLSTNQEITLISTGRIRSGAEQSWEIGGKTYWGFNTSETREKRWGTNKVTDLPTPLSIGYGTTEAFLTWFNKTPRRNEETQPVDKDSGGGAFARDGGQWELTGLVLAIGTQAGYPASAPDPLMHAIYGNAAYYADLTEYASQIDTYRLTPLAGDADWNGTVDLVDFTRLREDFGQVGTGLRTDFDGSGVVDGGDLDILQRNFGMISGSGITLPSLAAPPTPILAPEPGTMLVIAFGAPLLLRSRKRRGQI